MSQLLKLLNTNDLPVPLFIPADRKLLSEDQRATAQRIDIPVEVPLVDFRELISDAITGESSALILDRVSAAREPHRHGFHTPSSRGFGKS